MLVERRRKICTAVVAAVDAVSVVAVDDALADHNDHYSWHPALNRSLCHIASHPALYLAPLAGVAAAAAALEEAAAAVMTSSSTSGDAALRCPDFPLNEIMSLSDCLRYFKTQIS